MMLSKIFYILTNVDYADILSSRQPSHQVSQAKGFFFFFFFFLHGKTQKSTSKLLMQRKSMFLELPSLQAPAHLMKMLFFTFIDFTHLI